MPRTARFQTTLLLVSSETALVSGLDVFLISASDAAALALALQLARSLLLLLMSIGVECDSFDITVGLLVVAVVDIMCPVVGWHKRLKFEIASM